MLSFVRPVAILALVAGVMVAGCDSGGGGTTEPDPTRIQVTVRLDGAGESGLTVELFSSGGTTAQASAVTNTQGQALFQDVDPGSYDVETEVPEGAEVSGGGSARRSVTATEGQTAVVTIDLETPAVPGVTVVDMTASSFSPSSVTIDVGETIHWTNGSSVGHTVTPNGHSEWTGVSVESGGTFDHTFNAAGSFPYLCQIHAGMTGTITVQ